MVPVLGSFRRRVGQDALTPSIPPCPECQASEKPGLAIRGRTLLENVYVKRAK
jgi:hypothetical protein